MGGHTDLQTFERGLKDAGVEVEKPGVQNWLDHMTYDKKGLINLFDWGGLLDINILLQDAFKVPNLRTGRMEPLISALTDEEEEQFKNMMRRIHTVFQRAKELDVRVMVDAEQTYFQPAISRLTLEMMKRYNTEKAIVFNTYQCYLKEAHRNLVDDLEQANRQDFFFGAKLVRGAYMEQERSRAEALNYPDPINENFEATSAMYHKYVFNDTFELISSASASTPLGHSWLYSQLVERTNNLPIWKTVKFPGYRKTFKSKCFYTHKEAPKHLQTITILGMVPILSVF